MTSLDECMTASDPILLVSHNTGHEQAGSNSATSVNSQTNKKQVEQTYVPRRWCFETKQDEIENAGSSTA
ncbi:hypothetical protein BGZ67_009510, partial [Mortierella alpina]